MLREQSYSKNLLQLVKKFKNFSKIHEHPLTDDEILQLSYLETAVIIGNFLKRKESKTKNYKYLNIPRKYLYTDCEFDNEYKYLRGQNVFLSGPAGTGKTYLSIKLAKDYFCLTNLPERYRESADFFNGEYALGISDEYIQGVKNIVFVTEQHCIEMFGRDISNTDANTHYRGLTTYGSYDLPDLYSAKLLIINDLGNTKAHPKYIDTLFSILDSRIEDMGKRTIFTGNISMKSIFNLYGERFFDRIRAYFYVIEMKNESKRVFNRLSGLEPNIEFFYPEIT